jgi:hypothetical protein
MQQQHQHQQQAPPPHPRPDLERVEDLAARALSAPRAITQQVLQYLLAQHEVEGALVLSWLRERLGSLESYEQDLLLSPLFTPDSQTRLEFEAVLGKGWLDGPEVETLERHLVGRGLRLTLLHEKECLEAPLPEVVIDRYLRLLHLDSELPLEALGALGEPAAEIRACLRDAAWHRPASRALLPGLIRAALSASSPRGRPGAPVCEFGTAVRFLTDFIRTYRPASHQECREFLGNLAEAYEIDLQHHQSGLRSFFDEELKGSYGGKWKVPEEIVADHRSKIALALALREALGEEG